MSPSGLKVSSMLLRKHGGELPIAPGRMKQLGKSRNDTVMDVSDDESKIPIFKEQYCI